MRRRIGLSIKRLYEHDGEGISTSDLITDLTDEAWEVIEYAGRQLAAGSFDRDLTINLVEHEVKFIIGMEPNHEHYQDCQAIIKLIEWYRTEPPQNEFDEYYNSAADRWMLFDKNFLEFYCGELVARRHKIHQSGI